MHQFFPVGDARQGHQVAANGRLHGWRQKVRLNERLAVLRSKPLTRKTLAIGSFQFTRGMNIDSLIVSECAQGKRGGHRQGNVHGQAANKLHHRHVRNRPTQLQVGGIRVNLQLRRPFTLAIGKQVVTLAERKRVQLVGIATGHSAPRTQKTPFRSPGIAGKQFSNTRRQTADGLDRIGEYFHDGIHRAHTGLLERLYEHLGSGHRLQISQCVNFPHPGREFSVALRLKLPKG